MRAGVELVLYRPKDADGNDISDPGIFHVSHNGESIVMSARDPEHAAARALMARGITGTACTRHADAPHLAMTFDIEMFAKTTVTENKHGNPTLQVRRWQPFPDRQALQGGRSSSERPLEEEAVL